MKVLCIASRKKEFIPLPSQTLLETVWEEKCFLKEEGSNCSKWEQNQAKQ